jgi:broad specificity phosphatase PhoE
MEPDNSMEQAMQPANSEEETPGPDARHRPALLVVVRHGQSLRNTVNLHAGLDQIPKVVTEIPDHLTPLTDEGEQQAATTGQGLQGEFGRFDVVFHSPWLRTTQTAELLLQAFPEPRPPLRRNLYLLEQSFGRLDPALWPHQLEHYEASFHQFEQQRSIVGRFYCRPPDGESWADVCMRTHHFLGVVFRPEWHGKRVLVVTHAVPQQSFRYHLEHPTEEELVEEYEAARNLNCGAGAYSWSPDQGWQLLFWNKVYY